MNDYKPGDTVTLEHDDGSKLIGRLVHTGHEGENAGAIVFDSFWFFDALPEGWRVTDHKPKVELPTEPGVYWVRDEGSPGGFDIIHKIGDGRWVDHNDGYYLHDEQLAKYSDYKRLVEVGTERERAIRDVLKYIDDFGWKPGQVRIFEYGHAARILEHFGYAP